MASSDKSDEEGILTINFLYQTMTIMQPQSNKLFFIIIAVLVVVLVVAGLYVSGRLLPGSVSQVTSIVPAGVNSFFDSQNAMVNGEITKVTGDTITVKNKNGASRDFKVSKTALITTAQQNSGAGAMPATPSSDLKNIQIGKQAMISFTMNNGEFEVNSIFPALELPAGSPPPLPSFKPLGSIPPVPSLTPLPSNPPPPAPKDN